MHKFSRRSLMAAAATATGLAMLPTLARAQAPARGYRLLVEDGIDVISVRTLVAGRQGEPATVGRIARDVLHRPEELRTVTMEMTSGRTIVVACPAVTAGLEAAARRSGVRDAKMAGELGRVLPAATLEMLVFA